MINRIIKKIPLASPEPTNEYLNVCQSGYEKCPPLLERRTSFFYLLRLPRIRRTRHESVKLIAK